MPGKTLMPTKGTRRTGDVTSSHCSQGRGMGFPRTLHSWCFCGQWPRSGILSLVLGQKKDGKHRCPPRSDIQPQDPLPPNNMTYHVGQVFGVIWYPVSTLSFTHLIGRGGKEEAKGLNRKGETMTSCRVGVWVRTSG